MAIPIQTWERKDGNRLVQVDRSKLCKLRMIYPASRIRDPRPSSNLLVVCLSPPDLILHTNLGYLGLTGCQHFDPNNKKAHADSFHFLRGPAKGVRENSKSISCKNRRGLDLCAAQLEKTRLRLSQLICFRILSASFAEYTGIKY